MLLDALLALRHIEIRHPARWGAKSPMRIISSETGSVRTDVLPVATGAAVAVAGVGAALAFSDFDSALRAPFALFHLFATPAAALSAWLAGMDRTGRLVVSVSGSLAVNLLAAQALTALDSRSARNSVLIISVAALIIFLSSRIPKARKDPGNRKSQFRTRA
ncbi:hypothetical protein [Streptomyces sp. NPDC001876]|uniref:hypothetical protein n=1 Tax=Streptomyces sp. NPDC001876 TaxID=3154402 RepID=UPI0033206CAB